MSEGTAAARPASKWNRRVEALTERLNPIIVKEIRQGLRTRVFWVCFGLMLLACFVISLVAYAAAMERSLSSPGQVFFFGYFFCLGLVHFFIIPYSAYRSLAREREEETWVLLSLTGLGAKRIIRGKFGSFFAQALLYGCSAGPFMLFSYYLNGIDLPTILTVIALGAAFMVFLTCVSVCAATLAESRLWRGLVHFLLLALLLAATALGLSVAGGLTFDGRRVMNDDGFVPAIAAALWGMISFGNLMYQAAAARLSLPTEDYAKGPRLALLFQIAGSMALLLWIFFEQHRSYQLVMTGQGVLVAALFLVGVFMLGGAEPVHEVHFRAKGLSLLRPGAVRSFRFVIALIALTTAVWTALYGAADDLPANPEPGLFFILATGAYAALFLSFPVVVARLSGFVALNTAVGLRVLTVVVFVLAASVPPLIGLLVGIRPDDPVLNLFNPLVGSVNFGAVPWSDESPMSVQMLGVLVIAALLLTVAADRMLAWREAEGRREREAARLGPAQSPAPGEG
ncbi:MAG: ABC transporter permease [Myxococcaceae bacterium]|nr:ABC transporter permease [Myxococcaceae bacterium]